MITKLLKGLTLVLILTGGVAYATLDSFDFTGAVDEQRYRNLIDELRCLVCQNESLAGSQAELAQDLREEVYKLMAQGKSDPEVVDFLVSRYGDFVLYNPPVKPSTYLLWFGPFVLLALAAIILFRSITKRSRITETPLTPEEQEQVKTILGRQEKDIQ